MSRQLSGSGPQPLPQRHPDLARVRLLCCDVDGVMTDGGLYYGADGLVMVRFNVLDGIGLKKLQRCGVRTCFISMTRSPIIEKRAQVLGIDHCHVGIEDKLATIAKILDETVISLAETAHIADDVNDLSLLEAVGMPVTVPGGVDEVKRVCRFVTRSAGGFGAVRELCDALVLSRQPLPAS